MTWACEAYSVFTKLAFVSEGLVLVHTTAGELLCCLPRPNDVQSPQLLAMSRECFLGVLYDNTRLTLYTLSGKLMMRIIAPANIMVSHFVLIHSLTEPEPHLFLHFICRSLKWGLFLSISDNKYCEFVSVLLSDTWRRVPDDGGLGRCGHHLQAVWSGEAVRVSAVWERC